MLTTYWNAMQEAMNRRIIVIFVAVALLVAVLANFAIGFGTTETGTKIIVSGSQSLGPYALGVPVVLGRAMTVVGELWMFLTIFAAAQILSSTLDRGWVEITFSKRTSRWRILLGRYLCGATLYVMMALIAMVPLAVRLWWVTGVPTWQIGMVVAMQTLGFAALLAAAALVSLLQQGVALPISFAVGLWFLSSALAARETTYYLYVESEFGRRIIDWIYYILPKCAELQSTAAGYLQSAAIRSTWTLWTTGLFTLAVLGLTMWLLERKSF